jgi:glycosyltransferase involved in cell wall biosynthesis
MTVPPPLDIIHTVASTQADHGGPSRSVPLLCETLAELGEEVRLVTTTPSKNSNGTSLFPSEPVETRAVEVGQGRSRLLRAPISFYRGLRKEVDKSPPDLLHDHGLWLPTNVVVALAAKHYDIPLAISTRGMLTSWALRHHRWKKRLAWWAYQRWILRQAALFHVTSQEEVDQLRRLGFNQPAAVIPNGVPLPELVRPGTPEGEARRALFLSRLHPKKGLPMLLQAWAEVHPEGWTLELVGPNEDGHRAELEAQAQRLGLDSQVQFAGPVSDDEKWDVYRRANLFILPTHSENFGIVVAEALAAEVPVITTTGAPWADLEVHDCGWWVEPRAEAIAGALRKATALDPDERTAMGTRGRRLVEEQYSWPGVAEEMTAAYRWLLGEGSRPASIQQA